MSEQNSRERSEAAWREGVCTGDCGVDHDEMHRRIGALIRKRENLQDEYKKLLERYRALKPTAAGAHRALAEARKEIERLETENAALRKRIDPDYEDEPHLRGVPETPFDRERLT